jgi:hypothetical protein
MEAGPEMDQLILAEVFREPCPHHVLDNEIELSHGGFLCSKCQLHLYTSDEVGTWCRPPYSTSDAAALEVARKLSPRFRLSLSQEPGDVWLCQLTPATEADDPDDEHFGYATTLALAICRAALKAAALVPA